MPDGEYIGISENAIWVWRTCLLPVSWIFCACKSYKSPSRFVINHQHDIWARARFLDTQKVTHTHNLHLRFAFGIPFTHQTISTKTHWVQVNFLQSSIENDYIWPMSREKIKWGGFTVSFLKVWCFSVSTSLSVYTSHLRPKSLDNNKQSQPLRRRNEPEVKLLLFPTLRWKKVANGGRFWDIRKSPKERMNGILYVQ